jgi:hypothetical protein
LFVLVYVFLFVGWARVIGGFIRRGPVEDSAAESAGADTDSGIITFAENNAEGVANPLGANSLKEGGAR